jgi:hypothetical protein
VDTPLDFVIETGRVVQTIFLFLFYLFIFFLHEHETLSFTLREEHRLRVFENRVLRRIFGHKRA